MAKDLPRALMYNWLVKFSTGDDAVLVTVPALSSEND
jgi:hypothetical protein